MRAVRYEPLPAPASPGAPGPSGRVRLDGAAGVPSPPTGEARIRPTRVGISAADVRLARGLSPASERPGAPLTLGHEFVGVVEQANPAPGQEKRAKELAGKRVVGSINIVCGKCDLCRAGLSTHCRSRVVLGQSGRDGCFADAFCLPIVNLHAVPNEIDDDHAVFAEPLAAALHAAHQIRLEGKSYITILGDGRIGLLCAQLMAKLNPSTRVLGKHESKLALCEKWGIKHRLAGDAGRRADQDVVIDCTGTGAGLELAMQLVRPRGKILVKGVFGADPASPPGAGARPIDLSPIVNHEIELIGSRCGSIADALATLKRGEVDVLSLISRRFSLDQALDALKAASSPETVHVVMEV